MSDTDPLDALVDKLADRLEAKLMERAVARLAERLGEDAPPPTPRQPVPDGSGRVGIPAVAPDPPPRSVIGEAFAARGLAEIPVSGGVLAPPRPGEVGGIGWDDTSMLGGGYTGSGQEGTGYHMTEEQIAKDYDRQQAQRRRAVPVEDERR